MTAEGTRETADTPKRFNLTVVVAIGLLVAVSLAIFSTIKFKKGETMQLAVRSDALTVRTAGPMRLTPVRARNIALIGVDTLLVPGQPEKKLKARQYCFVEDIRPSGTMAIDSAREGQPVARMELEFDQGETITFLRHREESEPARYSISRVAPSSSDQRRARVKISLSRGQQVRVDNSVIYQSSMGGQVSIESEHEFRVMFSLALPDASQLGPTAIDELGFARRRGGAFDSMPESGIVSGELAFLTMSDKPVSLRPGTNTHFEGLTATLQSLSFTDDSISANVTGEVDMTSLQVGRSKRDVQPKWFDFLLNSRLGRAAIGVIALIATLLRDLQHLFSHGKKSGDEDTKVAAPKPDIKEAS
jgi:hypothetical protein